MEIGPVFAFVQTLLFGLDTAPLDWGTVTALTVLAVSAVIVWLTAHGRGAGPLTETGAHARHDAMRRRERRAGGIVSQDPRRVREAPSASPGVARGVL